LELTINLDGLRSDSAEELLHFPPASDCPERKHLYFFWRGLESILADLYGRMEPVCDLVLTTGLLEEDELPVFEEMVAYQDALAAAVDWAAKTYGNCELLGNEEGKFNSCLLAIGTVLLIWFQ
jgi:hypothetical protein